MASTSTPRSEHTISAPLTVYGTTRDHHAAPLTMTRWHWHQGTAHAQHVHTLASVSLPKKWPDHSCMERPNIITSEGQRDNESNSHYS